MTEQLELFPLNEWTVENVRLLNGVYTVYWGTVDRASALRFTDAKGKVTVYRLSHIEE